MAESFPTVFCHNLSATVDPGVNDDVTKGYRPGSQWVNTVGGNAWVCTNNTVGQARWTQNSSGWPHPL